MKNKIMSKSYGEGIWTGYDPRFPGYFSGIFNIKGKNIEINNLKSSDLIWVSEYETCEKINHNMALICDKDEYSIFKLCVGETTNLNRIYFFNPQETFDCVFRERYDVAGCTYWWDEFDIINEFDITNKFTKFNYHAANN